MMLRPDQLAVAENLWRVLERVEAGGTKKASVLREAGIGSFGDSTKHLGHYAVNPAWPEERKNKARLNKKVKTYLNIIDAAVKLAGLDPDETLLDVFSSTSMNSPGSGRQAAPEYEELARTLRDIAEAIATKHGLMEYFQKVARERLVLVVQNDLNADDIAERVADGQKPNLEPDEIELGFEEHRWSSLYWPIAFYEATREHEEFDDQRYLSPYPAVILGSWLIGDRFPVKVESDDRPAKGEHGPFEGITWGHNIMELRFCIIPVGQEMRPEAALRIRTSVLVNSLRAGMPTPDDYSDEWEVLQFPGVSHVGPYVNLDRLGPDDFHSGETAIVCPSGRRILVRLSRDHNSVPTPINAYSKLSDLHSESKLCQFLPVTGIVLEDWLNHDSYLQCWDVEDEPTHLRVLGEPLLKYTNTKGFSAFKTGTIASDLDHCLMDTQKPLTMLDARAEQFVQLFEVASVVARTRRERKRTRLEARLRTMRGEKGKA